MPTENDPAEQSLPARLRTRPYGHLLQTTAPAREEDLRAAERAVRCPLPADLAALLRESDGIDGEYGLGLVWSARRIAEENRRMRSPALAGLYMPFEPLLFFGDAGNGDLFAHRILAGRPDPAGVFAWKHETDDRVWVAPGLETYIDWWLTGRFSL
ncbi:SMI1/KNR4 family protein [Nocardiopsis sp. CNT-189]|uniref:SMI1/KNR4 family protein n=1 Tax=Nocardiopsis oceanisediminis TaxID=2816862 RepID=UPI003B391CB7